MKRLLIIRALVILLTIFAAWGSDDEVVAEINEVSTRPWTTILKDPNSCRPA